MSEAVNRIRKARIYETIRGIDYVAKGLEDGDLCEKEDLVKLINRMLAFLDVTIKPKNTKK